MLCPAAGAPKLLAGEPHVQAKERGKDPKAGCVAGGRLWGGGGLRAAAASDAVVAPAPRRRGSDGWRGWSWGRHGRCRRRTGRGVRRSPKRGAPVGSERFLARGASRSATRAALACSASAPAVRVHVQRHDGVLFQHGLAGRTPRRALAHPSVQASPTVEVAAPARAAAKGAGGRGATRCHSIARACGLGSCRSTANGPEAAARRRSRGYNRLLHGSQANGAIETRCLERARPNSRHQGCPENPVKSTR